jgi:hypothetical protein
MQMLTGYWISQIIHAAARLGIADHLKDGARHFEELAKDVNANPTALYRLLRALAGVGIFTETEAGYFKLTPLAQYLRSDIEGSLRDIAILMGDPEHYNSWGNILHSIRTGECAFDNLFGMNIFEYLEQNPEAASVFNRAMTSFSTAEGMAVVAAYDFSSINTLMDVAGGEGHLLTTILQANPGMKGILFDLPKVIEPARALIAATPVADRCQLVGGSFFDPLPTGVDACILKHIIHDWDDERAIAILKQCHQALTDNGKVLLVEQVIPPGNEPFVGKLMDINMMAVAPGGKERTGAEYGKLLAAAGFRLTQIVPTQNPVSIVEAVKLTA